MVLKNETFARRLYRGIAFLLLLAASPLTGARESGETRALILGSAVLEAEAYSFLEEISDQIGPRMIGTEEHSATLDFLEQILRGHGLETRRQTFSYPGWVRGEARAEMLRPYRREIRCAALGYVVESPPVEADVAYVESKDVSQLNREQISGKILLVRQNVTYGFAAMQELAAAHEVRGLLYINRVNGQQLLARTANHEGKPSPLPTFTITQEAGLLMKRLLEDGETVRVRLENSAQLETFTGTNLIATLPGESEERVILGAHFDSWDLGQGSIDNGLGVAQLYDVARLLKRYSSRNRHTVEFVWFDAEEFGLWGSRHYTAASDLGGVRAMINLDMVGRPIALNAMGFDAMVPFLEQHVASLGAWEFEKTVANKTWLGSDHHPFVLKGIPAITYNAPMDPEDVRYYHDFADTMDKVDPAMLGEATGLIALLVHDLANDPGPRIRLDSEQTAELFRKAGLEKKLQDAGKWPFHADQAAEDGD